MKSLLLIAVTFTGIIAVSLLGLSVGTPFIVNYDFNDNDLTTSRPVLGSKKCTYGPSYWCYNITQARECGATKHCISKVWEPMKAQGDNDSICDICKKMVKEARDQLLSNETQDELKQVLEGSCNLIPVKSVAEECDKYVDEFIPELIDALASRMDPEVVCTVSGLCNSVRIDAMLEQMKEIEVKNEEPNEFTLVGKDSCSKCSHYLGNAINDLKKLSKMEILHQLFYICGQLGSYSDSCRVMAVDEMDAIYETIQKDLNPVELCGVFGLCEVVAIKPVKVHLYPQELGTRVWKPPQNRGDEYECAFCKQLISYLKNWFTSDTTKEEFKEIATGFCKQIKKYNKECLEMVNDYGDMLYNLIVHELDPEKSCVYLEQCNTTGIQGRVPLSPSLGPVWTILGSEHFMKRLEKAEKITGEDELRTYAPGFSYPMTPLKESERLTGDDERGPLEYYPLIPLDPATDMTGSVPKKGTFNDILPTCSICTFTVGKLIDLVGKNRTKESIDKAVESVCYVIPSHYEDDCLQFMVEYGDKVAEIILVEGSAHAVCTAIGLCLVKSEGIPTSGPVLIGEADLPFDRYIPKILANDEFVNVQVEEKPGCALCEFVMQQLDSMLSDNATEMEIKDTVEQVCKYMPKTVRLECRDFIDEYGDQIIQFLQSELDPRQVCTELKFCKGKLEDDDAEKINVDNLEMDKCDMCLRISTYLSEFLDDPEIDTSIEELVEKICPDFPKDHQIECKEIIEDYAPYLLSLLSEAVEKGRVCSTVNLCPSPSLID